MRWQRARELNGVKLKEEKEQEVKGWDRMGWNGQKQQEGDTERRMVVKRDIGKWVGSGNRFSWVGPPGARFMVGRIRRSRGTWKRKYGGSRSDGALRKGQDEAMGGRWVR
ncbi:hypothetical protein B0H13DRAFT_1897246 [Mycena leptocephala]|nr:hypothetical protein B0H13DRAFT_1897246 [Mycena leptocephala]